MKINFKSIYPKAVEQKKTTKKKYFGGGKTDFGMTTVWNWLLSEHLSCTVYWKSLLSRLFKHLPNIHDTLNDNIWEQIYQEQFKF